MDSKHLLFCPLTKVLGPSLKKLGQRSLNDRLLVFSERRPVPWPTGTLPYPLARGRVHCRTRSICLLVFSVERRWDPGSCCPGSCLSFQSAKRQAAWARRTRMARACLSFLSKKDQGQLLPGRSLLVFSGGEKTMGPGKTWACLSFLSKELQPPGSA